MAETSFALSVLFKAVDLITAPVRKITAALDGIKHPIASVKTAANSLARVTGLKELNKQLAESRARWKATSGAATSSAEKIARGIKTVAASAAVNAVLGQRGAVDDALGGLASLGVKNLGVVEAAATEFSENWSKFSKTAILEAAYKIKSGIGGLTDAGLGEFAKMAALTSTATRGNVEDVSMAFGQGYNVFRKQFQSDEDFANAFSAAMSKTVKDFQTDGGQLSEAMKNLGAAATNMKTPLAEQMVVLGNLQNVMGSGAAAGTAYKSVMNQLIPAGKKLGTSFTDANGAAMSIDQIIAKIEQAKAAQEAKGNGANFMNDLRQAFGDDAFAALSNLIGKSAELKTQIDSTSEATKRGAAYTKEMAKLADQGLGTAMGKLSNIIGNVVDAIGGALAPVVIFAADVLGGLVGMVRSATTAVPGLGTVLKVVVGAVAAVATAVGVASVATWAWNSSIVATSKTVIKWLIPQLGRAVAGLWSFTGGLLKGAAAAVGSAISGIVSFAGSLVASLIPALTGAVASAWAFTAALLANPITWVVAAIVALIAAIVAIWKNWDAVSQFLQSSWDAIKAAWSGFVDSLQAGVAAIGQVFGWLFAPVTKLMNFLSGLWGNVVSAWDSGTLWDAGVALFSGLWDGLKSVWESISGWLSEVTDILMKPFKMAAQLFHIGGEGDQEKTTPANAYKKAVGAKGPSGAPIGAAEAMRQNYQAKAAGAAKGGKDRVDVDGVVKVEFSNAPSGTRVRQVRQNGDQRIGVSTGLTMAMVP